MADIIPELNSIMKTGVEDVWIHYASVNDAPLDENINFNKN